MSDAEDKEAGSAEREGESLGTRAQETTVQAWRRERAGGGVVGEAEQEQYQAEVPLPGGALGVTGREGEGVMVDEWEFQLELARPASAWTCRPPWAPALARAPVAYVICKHDDGAAGALGPTWANPIHPTVPSVHHLFA
jgi:hypothetical protein